MMEIAEIERRIGVHEKLFADFSDAAYSDSQATLTQWAANHAIVLAELRTQLKAKQRENSPMADWTDDRVKTLTKLWNEGQSATFIAESLGGITRNGVIGKAHRLGLKRHAKATT